MTDKFTKVILTGILVCLIVIAFKPNEKSVLTPTSNVEVNNMQQFVQVAPNRIGIVDSGTHSGYKGQLIIFDFDPSSNTFKYVETLNAPDILDHPEEYGIPVRGK